MKEGGGEVRPEDIHEEDEGGDEVEDEAIVFVGGYFGGCGREGCCATGGGGDLGLGVMGSVEV